MRLRPRAAPLLLAIGLLAWLIQPTLGAEAEGAGGAEPPAGPAPAAEAEPAVEEQPAPAAEAEPAAEEQPAAEAEPAVEEQPAAEAEPAAEKPPAGADKMDIIFVVDTSLSMKNTDPNNVRILMLRALADFFRTSVGDRLALVQFAGWSEIKERGGVLIGLTAVPEDPAEKDKFYAEFKQAVEEKLKTPFGVGTDFNAALALGVAQILEQRRKLGSTNKIWVILFTDGDTDIIYQGAREKYVEIAKGHGRDPDEDRDALNDAANEVFFQEVLPAFEKMEELFFTPVDLRARKTGSNKILRKLAEKSAKPGTVVDSSGNLIRDVFLKIITLRPGQGWLNRNVYGYRDDKITGAEPFTRQIHVYGGTGDTRLIAFTDNPAFKAAVENPNGIEGFDPAGVVQHGEGERYRILELGDMPPGDYVLRITHEGKVTTIETAIFAEFRVKPLVIKLDETAVYQLGQTARLEVTLEGLDGRIVSDKDFLSELTATIEVKGPSGESPSHTITFADKNEARAQYAYTFSADGGQGQYEVRVRFGGVGAKGSMIKAFGFDARAEPLVLNVLPVLHIQPAAWTAFQGQKVKLSGNVGLGSLESTEGVEAQAVFVRDGAPEGAAPLAAPLRFDEAAGEWTGEVAFPEPGTWNFKTTAFEKVAVEGKPARPIEVEARTLAVTLNGSPAVSWRPDLKYQELAKYAQQFGFRLDLAEGETATLAAKFTPGPEAAGKAVSVELGGQLEGPAGAETSTLTLKVDTDESLPEALGTITFVATVNGVELKRPIRLDATYSDKLEKILLMLLPFIVALVVALIVLMWYLSRPRFTEQQVRPIIPGQEMTTAHYLKEFGGKAEGTGPPEVEGALNFRLPKRKADVIARLLREDVQLYVNGQRLAEPAALKHGDHIGLQTPETLHRFKYFSHEPQAEDLVDPGLILDDDEIVITEDD